MKRRSCIADIAEAGFVSGATCPAQNDALPLENGGSVKRAILAIVTLCATMGVATELAAQTKPSVQLANPASRNCLARGGTLRMERRPDGGQYGVCHFVDNYQCEEWALFRGECPVGGLRVTGYITPASRYCAITGGRYTVVANDGAADERGRLLAAEWQSLRRRRLLCRDLSEMMPSEQIPATIGPALQRQSSLWMRLTRLRSRALSITVG